MNNKKILLFSSFLIVQCVCEYTIPKVIFEAYKPSGFKASIPVSKGVQLFGFHGNINKKISQVEPGDWNQDITAPSGNLWSYYNPDIALNVGDTVSYWIFIQHQNLGYRKESLEWKVTELLEMKGEAPCSPTVTVVQSKLNKKLCGNTLILHEEFGGNSINTRDWTIDHYIPWYSADFEFTSYQNDPNVCFVREKKLFIKPRVAQSDDELKGTLDLGNSCTRFDTEKPSQCKITGTSRFSLPPVTSGKLVSNVKFRYGTVEIRAKLPAGDWLYPRIHLQPINSPEQSLCIAYTRGNENFLSDTNEDIGGRWLFGGLVLQPQERGKSPYLRKTTSAERYSARVHVFTVVWKPDSIIMKVDGNSYGEITSEEMKKIKFAQNDAVQLVLAVGVGGVNDFIGNSEKPWMERSPTMVRDFFSKRESWLPTWKNDDMALQVESVKVFSL